MADAKLISADPSDFHLIEASGDGSLSVKISGTSKDVVLTLYDFQGTEIASFDVAAKQKLTIYEDVPAGPDGSENKFYYLGISGKGEKTNYKIDLDMVPDADVPGSPAASVFSAPAFDIASAEELFASAVSGSSVEKKSVANRDSVERFASDLAQNIDLVLIEPSAATTRFDHVDGDANSFAKAMSFEVSRGREYAASLMAGIENDQRAILTDLTDDPWRAGMSLAFKGGLS